MQDLFILVQLIMAIVVVIERSLEPMLTPPQVADIEFPATGLVCDKVAGVLNLNCSMTTTSQNRRFGENSTHGVEEISPHNYNLRFRERFS
jgi:hypothetical protein